MAKKAQSYRVKVTGPGHEFERTIDETVASKILALVMTAVPSPSGNGGGADGGDLVTPGAKRPKGGDVSLAAYIKSKKGEQSQMTRFLATAFWLSNRSNDPLTATAVAKALSGNHQKKLANPADCLNKNVSKGFCENHDQRNRATS